MTKIGTGHTIRIGQDRAADNEHDSYNKFLVPKKLNFAGYTANIYGNEIIDLWK